MKFKFKNNIITKIIILYSISCLITATIFYKLIPVLLNYAPQYDYIDKLHGMSYFSQYGLVVLFALIIGNSLLYFCLRKVKRIESMMESRGIIHQSEVASISKILTTLPIQIYLIHIIIPVLIIPLITVPIFIVQKASLITFIKLYILVIVFFTMLSLLNLVMSQNLFKKLLLKINSDKKIEGFRIPFITKLFLQIIPIIVTIILFTSLIGYSYNIKEKGNLISELYLTELKENFTPQSKLDASQIRDKLLKIKTVKGVTDDRFIITPENKIISLDYKVVDGYFLEYLHELSLNNGGYVYDITGEIRGVIITLNSEAGEYIVGIRFNVVSIDLINAYLVNFIIILLLSFIVLYIALKSLANDIKIVTDNLNKTVSEKKAKLYTKLPITSNDEISDLVLAFNKIQDLVHSTIEKKNSEIRLSKDEIEKWYRSTVNTIRLVIDAKDHYTCGHSDRVSEYAVKIGKALKLPQADIDLLKESGIFHDVGKIGISDNILNKTGKLTTKEYNEVKKHPERGVLILSAVSMFEKIVPIVLHHHERYDGKGYPKGLMGKEIPYLARVLAIADAFDAMTTNRIYQPKLKLEDAIEELIKGSGTQFDPILVEVLIKLIEAKKIEIII
jgi:HD-GYP domain-containing protein (c-di-GMP phosphodiesterase class II)